MALYGLYSYFGAKAHNLTDPCTTHNTLSDPTLLVSYTSVSPLCTTIRPPGWYRYLGSQDGSIADVCPARNQCGTNSPIWMSGLVPTVSEGEKSVKFCVRNQDDCCRRTTNLRVKNCTNYIVFYLTNLPPCSRPCFRNLNTSMTWTTTPYKASTATPTSRPTPLPVSTVQSSSTTTTTTTTTPTSRPTPRPVSTVQSTTTTTTTTPTSRPTPRPVVTVESSTITAEEARTVATGLTEQSALSVLLLSTYEGTPYQTLVTSSTATNTSVTHDNGSYDPRSVQNADTSTTITNTQNITICRHGNTAGGSGIDHCKGRRVLMIILITTGVIIDCLLAILICCIKYRDSRPPVIPEKCDTNRKTRFQRQDLYIY